MWFNFNLSLGYFYIINNFAAKMLLKYIITVIYSALEPAFTDDIEDHLKTRWACRNIDNLNEGHIQAFVTAGYLPLTLVHVGICSFDALQETCPEILRKNLKAVTLDPMNCEVVR